MHYREYVDTEPEDENSPRSNDSWWVQRQNFPSNVKCNAVHWGMAWNHGGWPWRMAQSGGTFSCAHRRIQSQKELRLQSRKGSP
jgi:hypothetical protein